MLIRLAVCLAVGAARLVEIAYSARNLRDAPVQPETPANRRVYPLIVAVHTATIVATLVAGGRVRGRWLLVLVAAQPLRIWVLHTLGRRWNTRGVVPEDVIIETGGPYRYVRHPNYTVVAVELATLPLAFGLRSVALLASLANAAVLAVRIREEERLLFRSADYERHFRNLPRFLPFLF